MTPKKPAPRKQTRQQQNPQQPAPSRADDYAMSDQWNSPRSNIGETQRAPEKNEEPPSMKGPPKISLDLGEEEEESLTISVPKKNAKSKK